jgi:phage shock protein PspC (stress-responsive transcriptional regulator)
MIGRGSAVYYEIRHSPQMLCGVCADLADRSGVPVSVVRAVAILLLLMHAMVMVVVYLGLALWLRGKARGTWSVPAREEVPPSWDDDGLSARFNRLDRRLARMERAALDREAGLHRAFRDL